MLHMDANDPSGQDMSFHLDSKHHVWKHRINYNQETGSMRFIGKKSKIELGSTLLKEEYWTDEFNYLKEEAEAKKQEGEEEEEEEEACGSCFGAGEEGECCQTCEDVKRAYRRKGWHLKDPDGIKQCAREKKVKNKEKDGEGCNVHGVVALDSGGGNFHLAPGRDDDSPDMDMNNVENVFAFLLKTFEQWNVSHTVHKIRFGDEFPGHVHQLDNEVRFIGDSYGMFQYYFKVR